MFKLTTLSLAIVSLTACGSVQVEKVSNDNVIVQCDNVTASFRNVSYQIDYTMQSTGGVDTVDVSINGEQFHFERLSDSNADLTLTDGNTLVISYSLTPRQVYVENVTTHDIVMLTTCEFSSK